MCLLALLYNLVPDSRLVVWANREESYVRPSNGPALHSVGSPGQSWVGGTDASAGGTWLGINRAGLLVAITNRRVSPPRHNPLSRGMLCRRLLTECDSIDRAADECLQILKNQPVAGCNVVIAGAETAVLIEHTSETTRTNSAARTTLVANGRPDDRSDSRLQRVRQWIEGSRPTTRSAAVEMGKRVCAAGADGANPPVCLVGPDRGTVSSAVFAMDASGRWIDYQYTLGPPHQSPFVDGSDLLTKLFL